jgi:hypothetical protein
MEWKVSHRPPAPTLCAAGRQGCRQTSQRKEPARQESCLPAHQRPTLHATAHPTRSPAVPPQRVPRPSGLTLAAFVEQLPGSDRRADELRNLLDRDSGVRQPILRIDAEHQSQRAAEASPNVRSAQWWWPCRPRVSTGVAPGRVHCGTGRLVGPQVATPSASERQYQHAWRPSGQPSGLSSHASPRP